MQKIIIISMLFFTSCSLLTKNSENYRKISSVRSSNCLESFNEILEDNFWGSHALEGVLKNKNIRKQFLDYIHYKYPEKFRKKIGDLALKVNGHEKQEIYLRFFIELEKAKKNYSKFLGSLSKKATDSEVKKQRNWIYVYPDKFAINDDGKVPTFKEMSDYLDYWKEELKADVLYFLPMTKSPKKDGGYDVSDYKQVIDSLGGNEQFFAFLKMAREKDINIVMDFVPGHISDEHPWFQKALAGDPKYINYFLNKKIPPDSRVIREGGNAYVEYQSENGPYRRLLLFPDITETQWNPSTLSNGEEHYFYSSFFPFQKDLNLQNSDVLGEHFSTLGFWLSNGVGGIRADAIPWWVKLEGTSGVHSDETFAISELFYSFIQEIKPDDGIYLPELVDGIETGLKYLGKEMPTENGVIPEKANNLFNFEKVVHILGSAATGDFKSHFDYLKKYRGLDFPEGYEEVIYTGNHHDEIYLGFLPEDIKRKFSDKITQSGGIVYKEGNSAGAMVSEIFGNDSYQIKQFFKWLYGHFGSKAIYQGMELGQGNSWEVAYKQTDSIIKELIEKGDISETHPAALEIKEVMSHQSKLESPPSEDSPLWKFVEGRLLHRNPILKSEIEKAKKGDNPLFNFFKFLTRSQGEEKAFKEGGVEEPLNTLDSEVGSFMRRARDGAEVIQEIAVIKNGSSEEKVIRVSLSDLTDKENFKLIELENNSEYSFHLNRERGYVEIELKPHETVWLEVQ